MYDERNRLVGSSSSGTFTAALPKSALLVVDDPNAMIQGDGALRDRLVGLGFSVALLDDDGISGGKAAGYDLVVVSESTSSTAIGTTLRDIATPVVVMESLLYDDMAMASSNERTAGYSSVTITNASHPLAAGLTGTPTTSATETYGWAVVGAAAQVAATLPDDSTKATVFGYEAGASLVTGTAAARRVGLFVYKTMPPTLTTAGWALFDAAVNWAAPAASPRSSLLVVDDPAALGTGDVALRDRLAANGYPATIVGETGVSSGQAAGHELVVISESVSSTAIGTTFKNVAVPVIVNEALLLDDMAMASSSDRTAGHTSVVIADATHPLAAGLSGTPTTTSASETYAWGVVGSAAQVAATLAGDSTKATVFGYEQGAALVSGNAAGRRIGFFAYKSAPATFTANGWALFDAAVSWATTPRHAPRAVLVGDLAAGIGAGDTAIRDRLTGLGFAVTVVDDGWSPANLAAGNALVVISQSVSSANIGTAYRNLTTPVLVLKTSLYDEMSMTGATASDQGSVTASSIDITNGSHLLAAGLTGTVAVTSAATTLGWGLPTTGAARVASAAGDTTKFTVFGYEKGQARIDATAAPARRVGLFMYDTVPPLATTSGWQLFDAAATWAAGDYAAYGWAAVGDLATTAGVGGPRTLSFDGLGRQTRRGASLYEYDALDRLVKRGSTALGYAGEEGDPSTYGTKRYTRTPSGDLAAVDPTGSAARFAVQNRHGDLAWLVDTAGTATDSRVWEPYGAVAGSTGSADPSLGYQGDFTDPTTGNVWMGARWYQPSSATFTSRDDVFGQLHTPISLNRYTYANGDPLEFFDPTGEASIRIGLSRFTKWWPGKSAFRSFSRVAGGLAVKATATVQGLKTKMATELRRGSPSTATATSGGGGCCIGGLSHTGTPKTGRSGGFKERLRSGLSHWFGFDKVEAALAGEPIPEGKPFDVAGGVRDVVHACTQSAPCRVAVGTLAVVAVGAVCPACVPGMIAGGAAGAAFGAATCHGDRACVVRATITGAAGGGVPLVGGGTLGAFALNGARIGAATSATHQLLQGDLSLQRLAADTALGAGTGAAIGLASRGATRVANRATAKTAQVPRSALFSGGATRSNADVVANGGGLPRTPATVSDVAGRAGVDLDGVSVRIIDDPEYIRYLDSQNACACTPVELGGREIHLGPASFVDEPTLAATLAHERTHVAQLLAGRLPGSASIVLLEAEARAAEAGAVSRLEGGLK